MTVRRHMLNNLRYILISAKPNVPHIHPGKDANPLMVKAMKERGGIFTSS